MKGFKRWLAQPPLWMLGLLVVVFVLGIGSVVLAAVLMILDVLA